MSWEPWLRGRLQLRARRFLFAREVLLPAGPHLKTKETAGLPLIIGAIFALLWANSVWGSSYHQFFDTELSLNLWVVRRTQSLKHWVNDLLLPLFFFVIGLEIKHQVVRGHLSSWKRAAMPVATALGGMLVPATIYLLVNVSLSGRPKGWGVPIATDIVFALAVLSFLKNRIPDDLRILTLAFAVVDDIGGVLVIAVFYSQQVSLLALGIAGGILAIIVLMARFRVVGIYVPYVLLAIVFMVMMLASGVHTTIGGFLLGVCVKARPYCSRNEFERHARTLVDRFQKIQHEANGDASSTDARAGNRSATPEDREDVVLGQLAELIRETEAPVAVLVRHTTPLVNYVVLPVFALANAGLSVNAELGSAALGSVAAWGTLGGLLLGKPIGIVSFGYVAQRLGIASLPEEIDWRHMIGMGLLAGIGFTVSLFIAALAFAEPRTLASVKLAVLCTSVLAGLSGYLFLRFSLAKQE